MCDSFLRSVAFTGSAALILAGCSSGGGIGTSPQNYLSIQPTSLTFSSPGSAAQTVAVSAQGSITNLTETDDCATPGGQRIVSVTPSGGAGSSYQFSVVPESTGSCSLKFSAPNFVGIVIDAVVN